MLTIHKARGRKIKPLFFMAWWSPFFERIASAWGFPRSTTADRFVVIAHDRALYAFLMYFFKLSTSCRQGYQLWRDQRRVKVYLYSGTLLNIVKFSWLLHRVILVPAPSASLSAVGFLTNYIFKALTAILHSSLKDIIMWFYCKVVYCSKAITLWNRIG